MAEEQIRRFTYTARNAQGAMVSGAITADSETGASRRLQAMGLAPLSVRKADGSGRGTGLNRQIGRGRRVKPKHLAVFGRQFATMTMAGLPLVRAINALAEQADHPELRRVLPLVRNDVEGGTAFSVALSRHPRIFPPLLIGMVASGEVSGSLGLAMEQVAANYEKEARLRAKIFSAMLYPTAVLAMAFVMVTAMLLFVVPRFASIFAQLGGRLPLPTRILVVASHLAGIAIPILIVGGIVFTVWWRRHAQDRAVRLVVDPLKLRIPIFGVFFQKIAIARFARTFSTLLSSGVPMLQALDIVSATSGSLVISDALGEVRTAVRAGRPVASTLGNFPVFPPLVVQMVSTGEETGALANMLSRVAEFYEEEVDTASEGLTALIEPILIVMLALVVGSMVVSLYLPIFKVFDLIK